MNALGANARYVTNTATNVANVAKNTSASMMNRIRGFFGKTRNNFTAAVSGDQTSKTWLIGVFGMVVLFFVILVLYNETIGTYISDGFRRVKELIHGGTDIKVDIDPGVTGTPVVSVDVTKQIEETPKPAETQDSKLTASLLPEPVTVPTTQDEPPKDSIDVRPEDRPAGMPGAVTTSLGSSILTTSASGSLGSTSTSESGSGEVFNVSPNIFTFNDAAAVCAAAGAELATYEQVKEAYDKGADWCNYGWIKGQMAVYPTQKSTYEKLQKGAPEWRNACGLPGVNGGYFDNPELRFGVNCFGTKPTQKSSDIILDSQVALPQTPAEIEFEKRVQKFRDQMDTAPILPFTKGKWNQ